MFMQVVGKCQFETLFELRQTSQIAGIRSRRAHVVEGMGQDIVRMQSTRKLDRLRSPGDATGEIAAQHVELRSMLL